MVTAIVEFLDFITVMVVVAVEIWVIIELVAAVLAVDVVPIILLVAVRSHSPFRQIPPGQIDPFATAVPETQIVLTHILGLWQVTFWQIKYCGIPVHNVVVVVVDGDAVDVEIIKKADDVEEVLVFAIVVVFTRQSLPDPDGE